MICLYLNEKITFKRLKRLDRKSIYYAVDTKAQQTLQKHFKCQKATQQHNRRTKKTLDQKNKKRYKLHQAKKTQKHKGH
ncbi:DUF2992 family protein [Levilactobacillus brevis]|uniref:DUF2992 family protein n=1 Tax=Levilactobacillus brevis TaxID=1580 RepID=UPI0022DEF4FD|nr:DUF2992 family protein [Levilactobacillus brevis]